jgi:CDP-diacylglycerol--glycerol-3-phosphate 3-phosphatidyltransferase
MANRITLLRFFLLFALVVMAYQTKSPWLQLANMPLLVLVIFLDAVDGFVARKFKEASLFGAVFDIMIDRVTENVLWIVLADLRIVPVWVALVFIVRSLVVDNIRSTGTARGQTPFGMIASSWGKVLVSNRPMRAVYGAAKTVTFGWLFMLQPWPQIFPGLWADWGRGLQNFSTGLIYITVALCVLRSVPVIAEFLAEHKPFAVGQAETDPEKKA